MARAIPIAVFTLLAPAAAFGQPYVAYRGVLNVASYLTPGLPNGSIARGSMFALFGRGVGPATPAQAEAFPLQTTLAGVSIELVQGATRLNALPVFVSGGQINAILPSNTPLGRVALRVSLNGQQSNPVSIMVTDSSVGLFAVNSAGFGPASAYNYVPPPDIQINSLAASAMRGQIVTLYGTGLGAVGHPDQLQPVVESLPIPVEIHVGGKRVTNILYSGRTPCCSGIDQYVFAVPADAPAGCFVPVVVRTRGAMVSNTVTMAIELAGAPCSDAHNPLNALFRAGGRTAIGHLLREDLHVDLRVGQPYDAVADSVFATFRNEAPSDYYYNAIAAMPPLGACTVLSSSITGSIAPNSPFGPRGTQVAIGSPLTVESPARRVELPASAGFEGLFSGLIGGTNQARGVQGPVFNAGPFALSAPGSGMIAAFRASLEQAHAPNWSNRDQVSTVRRARDLTLTWSGSPGESRGTAIFGLSRRVAENASAAFLCLASPGASSFTVPSYVLAALPASSVREPYASAQISIGNVPFASAAALAGFDHSFLGVSNWSGKTVVIE